MSTSAATTKDIAVRDVDFCVPFDALKCTEGCQICNMSEAAIGFRCDEEAIRHVDLPKIPVVTEKELQKYHFESILPARSVSCLMCFAVHKLFLGRSTSLFLCPLSPLVVSRTLRANVSLLQSGMRGDVMK